MRNVLGKDRTDVQYVEYVRMYICTYVRMYLVPSTWYLVCIHMHPYAFICIRHASVCTHTPSHASITHQNLKNQHTVSPERQEVTTNKKRKYKWEQNDCGSNPIYEICEIYIYILKKLKYGMV